MLRRFKKQCERAGIVQEVRDRQYHIKPNTIKNQKNQDIKRRKKLDAKRASLKGYRPR
jgi:small subunit ribosomal protein S21